MVRAKCKFCKRTMSKDFSGEVHFVKGFPICPKCWDDATKVPSKEEQKVEYTATTPKLVEEVPVLSGDSSKESSKKVRKKWVPKEKRPPSTETKTEPATVTQIQPASEAETSDAFTF